MNVVSIVAYAWLRSIRILLLQVAFLFHYLLFLIFDAVILINTFSKSLAKVWLLLIPTHPTFIVLVATFSPLYLYSPTCRGLCTV